MRRPPPAIASWVVEHAGEERARVLVRDMRGDQLVERVGKLLGLEQIHLGERDGGRGPAVLDGDQIAIDQAHP